MSNNIRSKDILHCLPLLASILGKRYGVKVDIGGDTASTDGHTICLPSLPLDSDEKLLEQVRGYIDHESAHIRFSDFDLFARITKDPVLKHIMNIIEDWRVEKAMSGVFPGCRANLNKLIPHLIPEPFTAPEKPGNAILSAMLRTVRSWDVSSVQTSDCVNFVNHHFPGLWPRIQSVLDKVQRQCASTNDAIVFAGEIMTILQQYCQVSKNASQTQNLVPTDSSEQRTWGKSSGDDQQSTAEESTESTDSSQNQNESQSDATGQKADTQVDDFGAETSARSGDNEQDGQTQASSFTAGASDDNTEPCQASFDKLNNAECSASAANQKDIEALLNSCDAELPKDTGEFLKDSLQKACRNAHSYDKISVAKVESKWTSPLSLQEMAETKRATTALRTRLQSLLQASTLKRSRPARRGRLNSSKLYRGMIHDPKLFLDREEKQSLNTAIHILLDASGSMRYRIGLAGRTCYAVGKALETIHGLSLGISVFPVDREGGIYPIVPQGTPVHNRFFMHATGNTPLGESLWWTMQKMIGLPQPRKIILIVTDGEPSDQDLALESIAFAKLFGFELYGIGIHSEQICNYLPKSSITIRNLDNLPTSMFTILQKALLQK